MRGLLSAVAAHGGALQGVERLGTEWAGGDCTSDDLMEMGNPEGRKCSSQDGGSSTGTIAGIAIGVIVLVVLGIPVAFLRFRRKPAGRSESR